MYSDADIEMADLEEAGNRHSRRVRKFGADGLATLENGETLESACRNKTTGVSYNVAIRMDEDGYIIYSVDGSSWHNTAREAYAAS